MEVRDIFIKEFECTPPYNFLDEAQKVIMGCNGAVGFCSKGSIFYEQAMKAVVPVENVKRSGELIAINEAVFNYDLFVSHALNIIDRYTFGIIDYEKTGIIHKNPDNQCSYILAVYNDQHVVFIANTELEIKEEQPEDVFDILSL
jgi:hypothetical protein